MITLPDSPLSLWLDTYGKYKPEAPLQGEQAVDVAVVGGGFTGLATACELRRADSSLSVAVLEAETVGYGASGRNGSFAMTVFGLGFGTMAMIRGKRFFQAAHTYMERAVDYLEEVIDDEGLDCDKIRPGFLRVATTPSYIKRLKRQVELMNSLGFDGISWLEAAETQAMVNSERYLGAMWEPRLLLVDPAKLVREEKRLALKLGAQVYEQTPVLAVDRSECFRLLTPQGAVTAQKVVFATNAYSHLFPAVARKQIPAFTYMIATEPLSDEQLAPIGWQGDQGLEDARNLIHYYRLTPDKRIVMGGGPVGLRYGSGLDGDSDEDAWRHLEQHIAFLWPHLRRRGHHAPLGRAVLGDARPDAGHRLRRRPARRLQPGLHRPRRLRQPPERGRHPRPHSGAGERRAAVPVRQPAHHRLAAGACGQRRGTCLARLPARRGRVLRTGLCRARVQPPAAPSASGPRPTSRGARRWPLSRPTRGCAGRAGSPP